jgi:X-X-X-Leu-X-X-Gly heptad repeat protein
LRALSEQNTVFENVAEAMYRYSCDSDVMEQCRKIEDNQKFMAYQKNKIESLKASNADKDNQLADKNNQLADKNNQLADKNNQLADKDNIIADLTARLSYLESQLNKNK